MPPALPSRWVVPLSAAVGVRASIVIPGSLGISHVITHLTARVIDVSGAGAEGTDVSVLDGATTIFTWHLVTDSDAGPPLTVDIDEFDNDITLVGLIGNSLTIQFPAGVPNTVQQLYITGFDA